MLELEYFYELNIEWKKYKITKFSTENKIKFYEHDVLVGEINEIDIGWSGNYIYHISNDKLIIGSINYPPFKDEHYFTMITFTPDIWSFYRSFYGGHRYLFSDTNNIYLLQDGIFQRLRDIYHHKYYSINIPKTKWYIDNEDAEHVFLSWNKSDEDSDNYDMDMLDISNYNDKLLFHSFQWDVGWSTFDPSYNIEYEEYISPWLKYKNKNYYVYNNDNEYIIDLNIDKKDILRSWWNNHIFFIYSTKSEKSKAYTLYDKNMIKYMISSHRNFILLLVLCTKKSPFSFCCPLVILTNIILPFIYK